MLRPLAAPVVFLGIVLLACGDSQGPSGEPGMRFTELGISKDRTCGITTGASVYCWGVPLSAWACQQDPGAPAVSNCDSLPVLRVDSTRLQLDRLAQGQWGAFCGLAPDGTGWCGGPLLVDIDQGVVLADTFEALAGVSGLTRIAAARGHFCALDGNGAAWCWGDHDGARRGDFGPNRGTGTDFTPNPVPGGGVYTDLATAQSTSCAVLAANQTPVCWGYAPLLGDPAAVVDSDPDHCGFYGPCSRDPVPVSGLRQYSQIVAGEDHFCGLELAGAVYCWGYNYGGQLGLGDTVYRASPTAVSLPAKAVRLFAGLSQACALLSTDELLCWGSNAGGLLGPGPAEITQPVSLPFKPRFRSVVFGAAHACGLDRSGLAWCWGNNDMAQLGDGTGVASATPVRVKRAL